MGTDLQRHLETERFERYSRLRRYHKAAVVQLPRLHRRHHHRRQYPEHRQECLCHSRRRGVASAHRRYTTRLKEHRRRCFPQPEQTEEHLYQQRGDFGQLCLCRLLFGGNHRAWHEACQRGRLRLQGLPQSERNREHDQHARHHDELLLRRHQERRLQPEGRTT